MAECTECGRALTEAHLFCPGCGSPVKKGSVAEAKYAAPPVAAAVVCPSCGVELPAGARFCGECGGSIGAKEAASATTPPAGTAPVTPAAAPVAAAYPAYSASPWQQQASPTQGYSYPPGAGYASTYQGPPSNFAEYLAFRKMLTPALGLIAFWLFEAINVFYWIRFIYYDRYQASGIIFGLFALLISALLIRIFMEAAITIVREKSQA